MDPVVHFEMPYDEPMEIPGVGQYVSFMHPEGNRVSMLQSTPAAS